VTVTSTDAAGNTATDTRSLTVDRGTTVTIGQGNGVGGIEGGDNTINAAEAADGIVITGTAEAGSTVTVNGVPATVAANGTYTATIPAPTADGPLAVTVTSTDAAGNTATDTRSLTVDRGTTVTIGQGNGVGGIEGGDNTINAAEAADGIVITGTAEAGSTVTVNGVPATVAANGTYTATIPAPTADGPLAVTVTSTDAAGNTATDTRSLTVDRGTTVTIGQGNGVGGIEGGDNTINAAEAADGIVITGTAEAGSTVTVNGVPATVAANGTYTATIPAPTADGPLTVTVNSTDAAGNSATDTRTLTVDRGTQVAITGVEGGDDTINAAEAADGIVITGTAEAGSTVTVNGVPATVAANGTYTATIPAPTADGPLTVTVNSTDAAGNSATDTRTLTVDRGTQVAITGVEGGDDTINAAEAADGIVITGTAEAGSTVTVNGVPATVAANGTYTATIPAPTADGPLTVTVNSTDAAGNSATDTRTLTVDRGTQVAITGVEGGDDTINAAEAADGIVITGTAEAGSTVTVNGVPATVAANGTYTATIPAPTADGPLP
jgi:hypothetical protein